MREIKHQSCPLCQADARFYFADYDNEKYFDCSTCKRYQISVGAERYLMGTSDEIHLEISKFASKSEDDEAALILLSSDGVGALPQKK